MGDLWTPKLPEDVARFYEDAKASFAEVGLCSVVEECEGPSTAPSALRRGHPGLRRHRGPSAPDGMDQLSASVWGELVGGVRAYPGLRRIDMEC